MSRKFIMTNEVKYSQIDRYVSICPDDTRMSVSIDCRLGHVHSVLQAGKTAGPAEREA